MRQVTGGLVLFAASIAIPSTFSGTRFLFVLWALIALGSLVYVGLTLRHRLIPATDPVARRKPIPNSARRRQIAKQRSGLFDVHDGDDITAVSDASPADVIALYEGRTDLQADKLTAAYIDRRFRADGVVSAVGSDTTIGPYVVLRDAQDRGLHFFFRHEDGEALGGLNEGDRIVVTGVLKNPGRFSLTFVSSNLERVFAGAPAETGKRSDGGADAPATLNDSVIEEGLRIAAAKGVQGRRRPLTLREKRSELSKLIHSGVKLRGQMNTDAVGHENRMAESIRLRVNLDVEITAWISKSWDWVNYYVPEWSGLVTPVDKWPARAALEAWPQIVDARVKELRDVLSRLQEPA